MPDCTYCGKQVVLDFDVDEDRRLDPVEVCTGCGIGQRVLQILSPAAVETVRWSERVRREVREAWQQHRAQQQ